MRMFILSKLMQHKQAYENLDIEIPVFRMTCEEHKHFLRELDKIFILNEKQKKDRISYYLGIKIELVSVIEDYSI